MMEVRENEAENFLESLITEFVVIIQSLSLALLILRRDRSSRPLTIADFAPFS